MSLKVSGIGDDPFMGQILQLMELEFPGAVRGNSKEMFEAIVSEIIGTKQHRYGPIPDPEGLVAIRAVVRKAMDSDASIPILVPWGASKQGPWGVDIAEVMALKQLDCLARRVGEHYRPGVDIVVRLENLTDESMFGDDWIPKTDSYVRDFMKLKKAIAFTSLDVKREDQLMGRQEFLTKATLHSFEILEAMTLPTGRGDWLRTRIPEWQGDLGDEILDYYRGAYDKFYPEETQVEKDVRLSKYFAGAITRFQLGGTGARKTWGSDYLTLSFTGIPWGKNGKRIFYRTIPSRYTNQHRAPWIGKGYVRIKGWEATPAIAGWNGDGLDYNPASISFEWGGDSVKVSADYVVVE